MAITPSELAPITLNSTTLPTLSLSFANNINHNMLQHSGNLFPSLHSVLGADPVVQFTTTAKAAYDLIGFGILKLTTFNFYLALFSDYEKASGASHDQIKLATSASACAFITGFSVSQGGIATADVTVYGLSADGMTHPWTTATAALPTVASEPTLHTVGPVDLGGTQTDGPTGFQIDLGQNVQPLRNSGELYPQEAMYAGGSPMMSVDFSDPSAAQTALGFIGSQASTHALHMRQITSNVVTTTSMSFTTTGRASMGGRQDQQGGLSSTSISISCLSTDTTHPITVNTADTVS